MTTASPSGVSRRAYLILAAGLALVAAVAVTVAIALQPAPLTGDAEADAACNALATVAIEDGKGSGAKLVTLTDDERKAILREVMEHAERSSIQEIREAGISLGATSVVGGMPFFGEDVGFLMGFTQFGGVCTEHGWSPQAAGLLDE